jgi:hypothetical protein
MAQQEAPSRNKLVLVTSTVRYMGVGKAAEGAQIADVRLAAIEGLEWRMAIEGRRGKDILDVRGIQDCPTPEGTREATLVVAAEGTSHKSLVTTFSNTILLWCVRHGDFMLNPTLR